MNICLISSEYPSDDHRGGIATYTEKTAQALARTGHKVTVITESHGAASVEVEGDVTLVRLARAQRPPHLMARAQAVAVALNRLPRTPDIVQACEYRAEGFWYALRRPPETTLVTRLATPSSLVTRLNRVERRKGLRTRMIDRLERLQTRRSDAIISPTVALADMVCEKWRIPREKIAVIRTGVDFATRQASGAAALPDQLRDCEYLIYFGRLEARKGVHILAQALPRILSAYPRLHAVFAGEVQHYNGQSLREFVEHNNWDHRDRLHFFPRLSQSELYPILDQALFAVLPSLWENLANACLEALDMGKPVVATLGCGFSEVVENGSSGLLVPPSDVAALEEAMLTMLSDRGRLHRMSQAARRRAQTFGIDVVTQDLLRFYEEVQQRMAGRGVPSHGCSIN